MSGAATPELSPGQRLSSGVLKVDARKAVRKLRDHLLVDLHHYLLEITRAAVASEAPRIDIHWDSDDVMIDWQGVSPSVDELERLLDYVLSDPRDRASQRLKLLASGVNAALGLRPRFVDIYRVDGVGECLRIRYRGVQHDEPQEEGADEPQEDERPRCQPAPCPPNLAANTQRVHVRLRLGTEVLRRALARTLARELGTREIVALGEATHDLPVPLLLKGKPWPRPQPRRIVGEVPLDLPALPGIEITRAVLQLLVPSDAPASIDFLEHGVLLSRLPFDAGSRYLSETTTRIPWPVRVVVDAFPLPTNASRSRLRDDAALLAAVQERAREALPEGFAQLQRRHAERSGWQDAEPASLDTVARAAIREDASLADIEDVIGAALFNVVAALDVKKKPSPEVRRLLDVPLFRNGCGSPRSFAHFACFDALYAHAGEEPLPARLAPWMECVWWQHGRIGEQALTAKHVAGDLKRLLVSARAAEQRRASFLRHPPGEVALPSGVAYVAREAFQVRGGPHAGLHGQVGLRNDNTRARTAREAAQRPGLTVYIYHVRRPLEVMRFTREQCPLPADLAIAWDGRVRPSFEFQHAERDDSLRDAIGCALRLALAMVQKVAQRCCDGELLIDSALRALLRGAVAAVDGAHELFGLPADFNLALDRRDPLWRVAVWPLAERAHYASLAEIDTEAHMRAALCYVRPRVRGEAVDGRPVLRATRRRRELLARLIGRSVSWVDYRDGLQWLRRREADAALGGYCMLRASEMSHLRTYFEADLAAWLSDDSEAESLGLDVPAVFFDMPGYRGLAIVAAQSTRFAYHASRLVHTGDHVPIFGSLLLAADDDSVIPNERWTEVLGRRARASGRSLQDDEKQVELDLLAHVVAAFAGGGPSSAQLLGARALPQRLLWKPTRSHNLVLYLLTSAVAARDLLLTAVSEPERAWRERLGDVFAALMGLPLVQVADEDGAVRLVSLRRLQELHSPPAPVPRLRQAPNFATGDWWPLVVPSETQAAALTRWFGTLHPPSPEEFRRRRQLARERSEQRKLLAQKPAAADYMAPGVRMTPARRVREGHAGMVASVVLASIGSVAAGKHVAVCHRDRLLTRVALASELPVAVRLDVTEVSHLDSFRRLSASGEAIALRAIYKAAASLACKWLAAEPREALNATDDPSAPWKLIHALLVRSDEDAAGRERVAAALRVSTCWPQIQGGERRLSAFYRQGGAVYVSRLRPQPWLRAKRASELDAPILHVPNDGEGVLRTYILKSMSIQWRNVDAAVEALQRRRGGAVAQPAPRLPGPGRDARLRRDLQRLQVTAAVGELELMPEAPSRLRVIDLVETHVLTIDTRIPLQAVARIDALFDDATKSALVHQLELAAERLLEMNHKDLHALPLFVLQHVRTLLANLTAEERLRSWQRRASVFLDIRGQRHSFEALEEAREEAGLRATWFVCLQSPMPQRDYGRIVLSLAAEEVEGLRKALPLRNMTKTLVRDLEAEARAAAEPVVSLSLPAEVALGCLAATRIALPSLTGELGILNPTSAELRGIHLALKRRPLCMLDDGVGWPLYAVCSSDDVRPNRFFDGVATSAEQRRIQQPLRAVADELIKTTLSAPEHALAECWVDEWIELEKGPNTAPGTGPEPQRVHVLGRLWMPLRWQPEPTVQVLHAGRAIADGVVLRPPADLLCITRVRPRLPLRGRLLVSADANETDLVAGLFELAQRHALLLWSAAVKAADADVTASSWQLEAARWDLLLAGAPLGNELRVATATGEPATATRILAHVEAGKPLWWSDRAGIAEGAFPQQMPEFVLLDVTTDAAWRAVLEARGAALRRLGGEDPNPARSHVPELLAAPASTTAVGVEPKASWFERMVRRVLPPEPKAVAVASATPRLTSLRARVQDAELGIDVPLRAVTRGRCVRERDGVVHVNAEHPMFADLASVEALLLAAAVSELNRAAEAVTAAQEQEALLALLSADASYESPR